MAKRNADVVAVLEEIADLMDIKGENRFRVKAYRNAALTLGALGTPVADLLRQGADLDALPGIGPDLAGKIAEIVHTGSCTLLERLHKELPATLRQLLQLPGVGPKRVALLYKHLGVKSVEELHRAAQDRRVRDVPGLGADIERRILQSTTAHLERSPGSRRTDT